MVQTTNSGPQSSHQNPLARADLALGSGLFATPCREPRSSAIRDLRPTQMTVGYREVADRRRRWRAASVANGDAAFRRRIVPIVLGPGGQRSILDRHHWLCALADEGVAEVAVAVVDDLRGLEWVTFWRTLDRRGWNHPFDTDGTRQDVSYIPISITGLQDDPFRSLASALRRAGGYAKRNGPFSEFLWADFLRERLSRELVDDNFDAALREALVLARDGGPDATTNVGQAQQKPSWRAATQHTAMMVAAE